MLLPLPIAPHDNRFRVLVMEDNAILASQLLGLLARAGFETLHATDDAGALQILAEAEPHLLLLDKSTPLMGGTSFCADLRQTSVIPVLMLGPASDQDEIAALGQGADDYLSRPLRPPVLLARVVAALRRVYRYAAPAPVEKKQEDALVFWEEEDEAVGEKLPAGWVRCDACGHSGPRQSFEIEDFFGNLKAECPQCHSTEHIVFSLG